MTINLKIRNSQVALNENILSGDTYPVKDYIKSYMGGKWSSTLKSWNVDVEKVNDLITKNAIHIVDAPAPKLSSQTINGYCYICQSYCYGDCQS